MHFLDLIFWIRTRPKLKKKLKRHNKSIPVDNFVAPDGGWGWVVAIASGVSLLLSFATAENFGIIYRDQMVSLGFNGPQLTTIINIEIAMSSFVGLFNGPLFRVFTFRQIALIGSIFSFLGVFLTFYASSFISYVFFFSIFNGLGRGVIYTSACLAVNTYFHQRRRTAIAFQFSVSGLGPIVLPYILTLLMQLYGMHGTVLIFSGISLHIFACALIFQPVKWHLKKSKDDKSGELQIPTKIHLADRHIEKTLEKTEAEKQPATVEKTENFEKNLSTTFISTGEGNKVTLEQCQIQADESKLQLEVQLEPKSSLANPVEHSLKYEGNKIDQQSDKNIEKVNEKTIPPEIRTQSFFQKFVLFFDLDLLKDFSYINIALGLTLTYFVDFNFGTLTPFILVEFGFTESQIAFAMTVSGLSDLVMRFLVPVIVARLKFSNKTYLLSGIIGLCIGRGVLCVTREYYLMLGIFSWIGVCKGVRIIFWALILPDYVPLNRLPAATGLQLITELMFSMALGPLVGLIHDKFDYVAILIFLNVIHVAVVFSWTLEDLWRKCKR